MFDGESAPEFVSRTDSTRARKTVTACVSDSTYEVADVLALERELIVEAIVYLKRARGPRRLIGGCKEAQGSSPEIDYRSSEETGTWTSS